jgi:hypothetical protein
MATRALIGYLDEDRNFTCTYNHYDGYPEHLGKALNDFYNTDDKAKSIANEGYISYVNPEDGSLEQKHNEPADTMVLDEDVIEAGLQIGEKVDEYGGDYGYVWFGNEWMTLKNNGIRSIADQFDFKMPADGAGIFRVDEEVSKTIEEDYKTKWDNFITENQAVDNMWAVYVKSLVNDIRLNGIADYTDYKEDDFVEDYENYIAGKMDS